MESFIFYRNLIHSDPNNHPDDKSHNAASTKAKLVTKPQKTTGSKTDSVELCEPLPSGAKTGEDGAEKTSPSPETRTSGGEAEGASTSRRKAGVDGSVIASISRNHHLNMQAYLLTP